MTGVRGFLRSMILTAGAVVGSVCLLWTLGLLIAGVTPLVVLSGSMSPTLHPGDVAFARTVPADTIRPGDVVTITSDQGTRITHRVVEASPAAAGETTLRLKGDANGSVDAESYRLASVPKMVGHLTGVGYLLQATSSPVGIGAGLSLLVGCLTLGLWPSRRDHAHRAPRSLPRSTRPPRRTLTPNMRRLALLPVLVLVGAAVAPQATSAYYTDSPTISTPANGLDAAPWFTCHQAMTSAALSPFSYYRFNDPVNSTTAEDTSGNGRTAVMAGTSGSSYVFNQAQPCARDGDSAVRFTGTGYASGPDVASFSGSPGARWNTFTLSLWFRGEPGTTQGGLIGMSNTPNLTGATYDRRIYIDSTGRLRFGVFPGGFRTLATPAVGEPGYVDYRAPQWHMVTASLSAAGMKLYVDGTLLPLSTTEQGIAASGVTFGFQYSPAYWTIGAMSPSGWPGSFTDGYWRGSISKVGIWIKALTDRQIRDLYRSGMPVN